MEEIKIFGHKNPDTDTIMSSLVLEDLENKAGFNKAKADVLKKLTKNGSNLISKTSDARDILDRRALEIYEKDISASMLREYIRQKKDKKPAVNEYKRSVIIL